MRTAGEEVGFNLTDRVYSSSLTFGLSEMCKESPPRPGREAGRSWGCLPLLRAAPRPPGPAALQLLCAAASHVADPGQGFLTQ